jgi:DNA polymerase III delta prime subunit
MPFSTLIGNDRIKMLLRRALTEGRVGQSLLMAGPRGVGKHGFAIALAQALNCERVELGEPCGQCVPCRKIARGERRRANNPSGESGVLRSKRVQKPIHQDRTDARWQSRHSFVHMKVAPPRFYYRRRRMAASRSCQLIAENPRRAPRYYSVNSHNGEAFFVARYNSIPLFVAELRTA